MCQPFEAVVSPTLFTPPPHTRTILMPAGLLATRVTNVVAVKRRAQNFIKPWFARYEEAPRVRHSRHGAQPSQASFAHQIMLCSFESEG